MNNNAVTMHIRLPTPKEFAEQYDIKPDAIYQAYRRLKTEKGHSDLPDYSVSDPLSQKGFDLLREHFKIDAQPEAATPKTATPTNLEDKTKAAIERERAKAQAEIKNIKEAFEVERNDLKNSYANQQKEAVQAAINRTLSEEKARRTETENLLKVQITQLEHLLKSKDGSTNSVLDKQERILMQQIADLKTQLAQSIAKAATEGENLKKRIETIQKGHIDEVHDLHNRNNQLKESLIEAHQKELTELEASKETAHQAAIEALTRERDTAKSEAAGLTWKRKLPSLYDVVNITSNVFALAGFVVLFKWVGVLVFIITACTFYAIVQDAKTAHRGWSSFFGAIGAFVIEFYYSYSHLNLFEELLKYGEYPFGIAYQTIGLYFTILISGGSVYAVIMTALRSHADAEAQRIADIDNALTGKL